MDDGREVTIIGAMATPASARRLIRQVQRNSPAPIRRVIIDASGIDKLGGAAAFADLGVDIWAPPDVIDALPQVVEFIALERGAIDDEWGRILSLRIAPLQPTQEFTLSGGVMQVLSLPGGCNRNANAIVRLRGPAFAAVYVGGLVQTGHHPWLGGRIFRKEDRPDLPVWSRCVRWLLESGQFEGRWYTDEGPQPPGPAGAREFSDYLDFVQRVAESYVEERILSREDATAMALGRHGQRLAMFLRRRYPERIGDLPGMQRSLASMLAALVQAKSRGSRL